VPVIGFPGTGSPDVFAYFVCAFRQGLGEAGFVGGRNVAIEFSWANAHESPHFQTGPKAS
jgi:putative tryptophan/tyrosine transport system substrate-binding protein